MSERFGFTEARMRCAKYMPYLYKHVASLIPVPRPGMGSLAVDQRMRVYYDPAIFQKWTIDECTAAILHETLHGVYRHHARAKDLLGEAPTPGELDRFNTAADMTVNQVLRETRRQVKNDQGQVVATHILPVRDDWVKPEDYDLPPRLTMEEYYYQLAQQEAPPPPAPKPEPEEGESGSKGERESDDPQDPQDADDGQDDADDARDGSPPSCEESEGSEESPLPSHNSLPSQDERDEGDGDGGYGEGEGEGESGDSADPQDSGGENNDTPAPPNPGKGGGSGASDGQEHPWEDPPEAEGGAPEMSDYNQALIERVLAEEVAQYEREKGIGSVPGALARWAGDVLHPPVDPFRALDAALGHARHVPPFALRGRHRRYERFDGREGTGASNGHHRPPATERAGVADAGRSRRHLRPVREGRVLRQPGRTAGRRGHRHGPRDIRRVRIPARP